MTRFSRIILAATLAAVVPSLASAAEMKAEVLHWWTSSSESAAIKEFADRFKASGGEWIDTAIATGEAARAAGINRIVGGNPPTVMQFNTGKQLAELAANGFLTPLDSVAEANKWADFLPKPILSAITSNGPVTASTDNTFASLNFNPLTPSPTLLALPTADSMST